MKIKHLLCLIPIALLILLPGCSLSDGAVNDTLNSLNQKVEQTQKTIKDYSELVDRVNALEQRVSELEQIVKK